MTEVGASLRNEREKRGISLPQISQKTNINIKFLKALEDGDCHLIPGDFYIKYYLKNYLEAIDVDVKEFFKTHKNWLESDYFSKQTAANKYIPKLRYSRFKKKSLFLTLFTILLFVILASGFFYLYKRKIFHGWIFAFKRIELPETGITPEDKNKRFSIDRSPVNIRIDFLDNCWASVMRGKRERIEKTYKKGERLMLCGYELLLYIGNPSGVKLYLNEKEVSYLSKLTQPERLEINPETMERILKK